MLWISLDSFGLPVSAVYFQGRRFAKICLQFSGNLFQAFLYQKEIALDTVVIDGMSEKTNKIRTDVHSWIKHTATSATCRAILTSSTKVERLRPHQNDYVTYRVFHSWQLDEFKRALIDSHDKTTPLFEACAALFYDEYGIHKTTFVDDETCRVDEAGDAAPKKENGTDADEVPDSEMPDADDG